MHLYCLFYAVIRINRILVYNSAIDSDYWGLTWQKTLENGISNQYDAIQVVIDLNRSAVASYETFNLSPSNINAELSEEDAKKIVLEFIEKQTVADFSAFEITNAELTVFLPNNIFGQNKSVSENNSVKLAYKFTFGENSAYICVDAINGEILGGDIMQEVAGIYSYSALAKSTEAYNLAKNGFAKLGYSTTGSNTSSNIATTIKNFWNGAESFGFYFNGHASETVLTFNTGWQVTTSDVTGYWHFVYLDGCSTGNGTAWSNAFKISGANRGFLGWYDSVGVDAAYQFNTYFWPLAGTMSLRDAAVQAANKVPGSNTTPIRFYGDAAYKGFAWN